MADQRLERATALLCAQLRTLSLRRHDAIAILDRRRRPAFHSGVRARCLACGVAARSSLHARRGARSRCLHLRLALRARFHCCSAHFEVALAPVLHLTLFRAVEKSRAAPCLLPALEARLAHRLRCLCTDLTRAYKFAVCLRRGGLRTCLLRGRCIRRGLRALPPLCALLPFRRFRGAAH